MTALLYFSCWVLGFMLRKNKVLIFPLERHDFLFSTTHKTLKDESEDWYLLLAKLKLRFAQPWKLWLIFVGLDKIFCMFLPCSHVKFSENLLNLYGTRVIVWGRKFFSYSRYFVWWPHEPNICRKIIFLKTSELDILKKF